MAVALSLGARGQGRCWPNPAVGCVLVQGGRVVGRGWTQPGGRPHAETQALARAGAAARGATAYVTLEPCAHQGRTPPCADALIAAGVARVVVALRDPDPRVDGGGIARLREAGITVEEGVMGREAQYQHGGFLLRVTEGRPWLTLKLASSFDGRIATGAGDSQWITGPEARRQVHADRARHDAVLVGAGTARDDDPSLTVRGLGIVPQPVRVVASRRLDLPETGALARTAKDIPLWLLHGADADADRVARWRARGAQCRSVRFGPDRQLDPLSCLQALGAAGLTRVFCEGGGSLAAALLSCDLVDELVGYTAGLAIGAEGRPSLGAMGISALADAPRFVLAETACIGGDVMHRWRRASLSGEGACAHSPTG
ncbi:bifunctional diaminohydroxyphosphoribosylaminopyrimidine deaminase/5-amino-6-(5-phosphoribosylamino)uracil reductase RibD [Pseudoruegeria sp. SK021]|uniref:bifunctional diaminohydroxyphosphoribosylaminopyrimidine deaminase/5-amino-6-(5-phosphoribosylamino)uracil reductase RibD n=1 Tax=Pseudoruegeria sp. SK021 TaxID=1933035 RepID=UPI000A22CC83|nr:bifunctional diaminohydroxyphosphoribosylaminopyrimidine deaminase/5-amino-6-(5-phosphoribosylamino)uracil reductase RibD [Pseudoruegeria sp. SK021]OSP55513.1 riboflavin biosynthesis protein RibD [Pseudoruegeria sp. SK021]